MRDEGFRRLIFELKFGKNGKIRYFYNEFGGEYLIRNLEVFDTSK